jgi:hypothetical protein
MKVDLELAKHLERIGALNAADYIQTLEKIESIALFTDLASRMGGNRTVQDKTIKLWAAQ